MNAGNKQRHYYSSYDNMMSEVFVFGSRQERDAWVSDPDAMLDRVPISAADARILVGTDQLKHPVYDDEVGLYVAENKYIRGDKMRNLVK